MRTATSDNSENSDSIYEKTIRILPKEEANGIRNLLQNLVKISEYVELIITNLKNEQNLPEECMISILRHLSCNISENNYSQTIFIDKYKEICKKHALKSRAIQASNIRYYGNAVFKEELISRILRIVEDDDSKMYPAIRNDIRLYIDNLIQNKNIESLDHLKELLIHYPTTRMWATWGDTESSKPFDFRRTVDLTQNPSYLGSLCEVRLNLALAPNDPLKGYNSMLLLTYQAVGIEAHIPTIADAGTYQYFSPCSHSSRNGWTNPFHPELQDSYIRCLENSGHFVYSNQHRPEAVHKPITLGNLCNIEELLPIPNVSV
jgi:hypothetical protein